MREVKLGALQPDYLYPAPAYDCMSDCYSGDVAAIVENFVKARLQTTLDLLEQAGREGCDAVTTCEDICGTGLYCVDTLHEAVFPALLNRTAPMAEEVLSGLARRHSMYIVGCYNKRVGGRNYNVASIFDRQGRIVGEYRKTHLPAFEKWMITPGDALDVFDLDFGRVGIAICYDMVFPETVEILALKGAEVVFHPTAGYNGEHTLRARANDNSVAVITAKNYVYDAPGKSSVIDSRGQVLADAGFYRNAVVSSTIDLNDRKAQPEWHYETHTSGIADIRERRLRERRPELYGALAQGLHPRLETPDTAGRREIIQKIKAGTCRWQ
jgi:predicted amidohydrolase